MAAVHFASATAVQDAMLQASCADIARQVQAAIAGVQCTSPHVIPSQPLNTKGHCSSDASIAVGYSHSGEGGSYEAEDLLDQTSVGSKRAADTLGTDGGAFLEDMDEAKRPRSLSGHVLSHEEKLERRREGNRRAAQRLRQRRMETVSNLQAEIDRLEQERMVYLSHIYQLAASARSVVAENKMLRMRLEASKKGAATLTVDNIPAAKTAAQMLAQPESAKGNAATSRMDFDAVCRSLFKPEAQNTASWPLTGM
ncbi:g10261 [Coccomyxa viridis]|uniref:G10261 protein n=1 Tax=Coccomyxa viridis TaxID=1274662 RepID=A0ABP1G975_9CHLO